MKQQPQAAAPWFDGATGQYYLQINANEFRKLDSGDVKLHLRKSGLHSKMFVGALNELEHALVMAQTERCLAYSGPVAGYRVGPFNTMDGRTVLVTSAPALPSPKRGAWKTLRTFFEQLFGDQTEVAFAWHKCAFESLVKGDFRASQVFALAGPAGCGKGLWQTLTTAMLGGRVGKPYKFLTGETHFNADLAEAEHWCISDEHGSTDVRARRKLGNAIKTICADADLFIHGKGAKALVLPTYRRLTLSVNDETENLQIIPPLDASLADKITLVKCTPADVGSDRVKTWKTLTSELPAYLWHLLNEFEIPKTMRDPRYGVKSWHNPELLEQLTGESPEQRLLNIIDETLWQEKDACKVQVQCTADELERRLRSTPFAFAVDKLLYFSSATGVYLSRLEKRGDGRVTHKSAGGNKKLWIISPAKPA